MVPGVLMRQQTKPQSHFLPSNEGGINRPENTGSSPDHNFRGRTGGFLYGAQRTTKQEVTLPTAAKMCEMKPGTEAANELKAIPLSNDTDEEDNGT